MAVARASYHHGDLRAAILDSVIEVLDEKGPQGLAVREVARRAGVSHTAVYRHFADKDELILAVVEQGFERLRHTMEDEQSAVEDDPISQFAASGIAYVNFALNNAAYYRVMFGGELLGRAGHVDLENTGNAILEEMIVNIGECQALGFVRDGDPVTQALTIIATLHGFVSLVIEKRMAHFTRDEQSIDDLRDAVLTHMFQGLSA